MSLPTLLLKGNLEATKYSPPQEILDGFVPLDYTMQWFNDRIPPRSGENPKIRPNSSADHILIFQASTGSGKSTAFTSELYHLFQERTRKNIVVTQPRVLTAIEIPKNAIPSFNTKEALIKAGHPNREPLIYGKNIGTQTGPFSKRPIRGLIFVTPGILIQQMNVMSNEQFMQKYSIIVIDEAHERSLQLDSLLYLMKKFINNNYKNKDCPMVVVMSATFDTKKFCDFLLSEVPTSERYKNIIKVKGLTYPIEEIFLKYDSSNYLQSIVDKVVEIHKGNEMDFIPAKEIMKNKKIYKLEEDMKEDTLIKTQKFRDILIFVKGPGEIVKLKKKFNQLNSGDDFFKKYPVLPLGLTGDIVASQSLEYRNTVEKDISELNVEVFTSGKMGIKKPVRRVVVATNVAETGVTIETLKYVIEPGWVLSKEYNPCFATELLVTKPITQSMYKQRRGRVGRKAPGICYPMYTKEIFESMQEDQYPDIIKDDITLDLLNILIREVDPENEANDSNIFELFKRKDDNQSIFEEKINKSKIDIYKLDLLDLPSADSLHYSMEKLYILGAINSNSIPTSTGFLINKFRFIRIESIKMILSGYAWGVPIQDLVTMAAFLEYKKENMFSEEQAKNYKEALAEGRFTLFGTEQKKIISYSEFKTDLMVADEFVKYILIFNEFQKKLIEINIKNLEAIKKTGDRKRRADLSSKNIIENLQDWSDQYGVSIEGLLDVIDIRDTIINTMAMIGLNPYLGHENAFVNIVSSYSDKEKFDYICSIKRCIFEGYKLNLAVWNNVDKKYYSRKSHLPLNIDSEYIMSRLDILKYGDNNPKYIVYDTLIYLLNPKTNIYESQISHISIMDGYVTIDPNYDSLL